MFNSLPKLFRSSSRSKMEGWRKIMLLMVLTGDDMVVEYELRALLALDDADEDRRKLVLRLVGENRAVMEWKREVCILA
jgi:hypothetical protein